MNQCNNVKCGIDIEQEHVILWWQISLFARYEVKMKAHQLTVKNYEFQRLMMKAKKDMELLK
jgi:hypothetical protein